jgi:NADH-quinone oxidoreductase subunit N
MDIITLKSFIPEIFFSCAILFQLLYNIKVINNLKYNFPLISKEIFFQSIFILICLAYFYNDLKIEGFLSNFALVNDESTRLIKLILIVISCIALFIIQEAFKIQKLNFFEFYSILLLSILSLLFMISSTDLIFFYLTMEMQALCFYILASFNRNNIFSVEAGLKYFVSGSFISGFYLLGCSLIYGSLGTLNLHDISLLTIFSIDTYSSELNFIILIGVILITSTLLFKLACAPFHFWSPDVYDGAPIASTLAFSVLPKLGLFFFFIKWIGSLNTLFNSISDILLIFGILSVFLGTFFALNQKRLKRLIIYSSIAQTGFLVASLSVNNIDSFTALYFFLFLYLITSILIWGHFIVFYKSNAIISKFYSLDLSSLYLSSVINLFKNNKIWAFSFLIIFFSISGIPPLTGFLAKMLIIYELVVAKKILGSILLIIISSISVYYYIRVIKLIYFEPIKIISKVKSNFTIIFFNNDLDKIYFIFVLLLFILIVLFYFPTLFLTICQYVVIHSFGF